MAKPGAGKKKMAAVKKKQWNNTQKSLHSTGRAISKGAKKGAKLGKKGCYIATCVYGSYDCPEVWVLRRFRDETLECSRLGRLFISLYYATSPSIVRLFGENAAVRALWRALLDRFVIKLKSTGICDKPYDDDK